MNDLHMIQTSDLQFDSYLYSIRGLTPDVCEAIHIIFSGTRPVATQSGFGTIRCNIARRCNYYHMHITSMSHRLLAGFTPPTLFHTKHWYQLEPVVVIREEPPTFFSPTITACFVAVHKQVQNLYQTFYSATRTR
jgi:hypothetical protein